MNFNNLLENNQLEFQEAVAEKFICLLCRKILRDPHIVPCGHSYCFSCVKDHIKNEASYCIGDSSDCNLEPLDMSKNVLKDFRVNKEINELKVKCVNKNCSDFIEIKNMELHMQSCRFKIATCPFEIVGCAVKGLNQNDLKDHLVQSSLDHATIMTKCVEDLRNKNNELLLKIDRMQQQFEQLENEVSQNKINLESKIMEENVSLKNEIMEEVDNKIELGRVSTKQECESKIMYEKWEIENQMTMEVEQLENKMTTKVEQLENKFYLMKEELLNKFFDQIKEGNDKKIKRMNIGENYVAVDKEVKVTFDNMSRKERDKIYKSDLFMLERYSFKLRISYKSNYLITFGLELVKGQYDEEINWPMKRTIQLNILNCDGHLYNCHEFSYETGIEKFKNGYNKPNADDVIGDSNITIFDNCILYNDAVTVIVKMID